jgi:hypothetical protein
VGIFLERDDGKSKTIELIDITESDRVSALGVGKILDKYSQIEYIDRQEVYETWVKTGGKEERVQKVSEERSSGTYILLNPECDKILSELNPIAQSRVGLLDLAVAINDNILSFPPSLEKEVKQKISEVTSEFQIETNPYISVLLMGVGYLNREIVFNTRNIGRVGGEVFTRLRTDADPEYIPANDRSWSTSTPAYSNPNSAYFNAEMARTIGRRF